MSLDSLTTRDFFAGVALVALHAIDDGGEKLESMPPRERAEWAYKMAEEMLEVRKVKKSSKKKSKKSSSSSKKTQIESQEEVQS